jgi:hypothetical protein
MIETTVSRLQEELQELQELMTLLADLASTDSTLRQEIDRATATPSAPSEALPPAVPPQLPIAQHQKAQKPDIPKNLKKNF